METFSKGGVPSLSPARDGSLGCSIFFLRNWNKKPYVFLRSWSSRSFFICNRILSISYTTSSIRSICSSERSLMILTWDSNGCWHDRHKSFRVGRGWLSVAVATLGFHDWHWQVGLSYIYNKPCLDVTCTRTCMYEHTEVQNPRHPWYKLS